MDGLSWEQIYKRQQLRADLVPAWFEALGLGAGDRVLDIGCGPGYVTLLAAEAVGPSGTVYAVDRDAEALAYLGRLAAERGIGWVRSTAGDAAALHLAGGTVGKALLTMVLHHCDDPAGVVRSLAGALDPDGVAVLGEFHPDGPCLVGVERERRIAPEQLTRWCEAAGLVVTGYVRQTDEHYMLSVRKG